MTNYQPKAIEIELTHKCNLRCRGCAILPEVIASKYALSDLEIISVLKDAYANGIGLWSLTGGEPLLQLPLILNVLQRVPNKLVKINTNGFLFSTTDRTIDVLTDLKNAGFISHDKKVLPTINMSIGQQTQAGVSINNAVNVASVFQSVFKKNEAGLSFNVFSQSDEYSELLLNQMFSTYQEKTGKKFKKGMFQIRLIPADGISSSTAKKNAHIPQVKIKDLVALYQASASLCLSCSLSERLKSSTSPRMLIRADGSAYACSGFSQTFLLGNIKKNKVNQLLVKANENIGLNCMMCGGFFELLRLAEIAQPRIGETHISFSTGPCNLCKVLSSDI